MLYPYRIRVYDIRTEKTLDRLMHDRTATIEGDKNFMKKLGHQIRPIRKDIFIGYDLKYRQSNISLKNPFLKMEKKNKDYIFKM